MSSVLDVIVDAAPVDLNQHIAEACRPIREERRPFECPNDSRPSCWVCNPKAVGSQSGFSCMGCGGAIDPRHLGNPTAVELKALELIMRRYF